MKIYLTVLMTVLFGFLQAQEQLKLYDELPNTKDTADITKNSPALYAYIPKQVTHSKVFLILPGGGYSHLAMDHEGHQVAQRLADLGYCAFVLKYRLPSAKQQVDKRIAPIQDAQRALVVVKEKIKAMKLKKARVGVMGFSAGGHLASTLSTHFETDYQQLGLSAKDLRPDFSILVYPVISMETGITHQGSKNNLLGPNVSAQDEEAFSNDKRINKNTPPAYLIHAKDDKTVIIENSLLYQRGLDKFHIANDLFSYELGGHGFGMYNKKEPKEWFLPMLTWVEKLK